MIRIPRPTKGAGLPVGVGWLAAWVAFSALIRLLISVVFINHEVWVHAYSSQPPFKG